MIDLEGQLGVGNLELGKRSLGYQDQQVSYNRDRRSSVSARA